MGFLDKRRIRKAIDEIRLPDHGLAADKARAGSQLKRLRMQAVPMILDDLAAAPTDPKLIELLSSLLDNRALPAMHAALVNADERLIETLTDVLAQKEQYDANLLLDWFHDSATPKTALATILCARKEALSDEALGHLLSQAREDNRVAIYRFLESVATPSMLPSLLIALESDDWPVRLSIARTLRRFDHDNARDALTALLGDRNKAVRLEALEGLSEHPQTADVSAISPLLRDPDLTVQGKAIETIIAINDPRCLQNLLDVLQDESEYVRRAAVEVLNKVGNTSTIKDLLHALRDKDWWVRVRAADALGTIGGPRVVEATISLLRDEDEFMRRCAVEILNTSKDAQAFDPLVEALDDDDWWVRERAVDALAALGDLRATPILVKVLEQHPEAASVVLTALAGLNDPRSAPLLLPLLNHEDESCVSQVLGSLNELTDGNSVEEVERALQELLVRAGGERKALANKALASISARFRRRTRSVRQETSSTVLDKSSDTQALPAAVSDSAGDESSDSAPAVEATLQVSTGGNRESAPMIDATTLEIGTLLGDRYRVVGHIRGGAFGVVVLAMDEVLNERLILKFLRPHLASDEHIVQRFMQELRYARKISHDNVIRIHDFLSFGKSYAISMEYFDSEPLSTELQKLGHFPVERALRIFADICEGMIAAHNADVVHRDLKPANLLVNAKDEVKIVDFGVAAASSYSGTRLTATGMVVGTPTYMSPEQIRGQEFDKRSDIYSLGVILYEMLTGKPPHVGDDAIAIIYQHLEGRVIPPRELVDGIPAEVEAIVLKAMATKVEHRFQSVEDLKSSIVAHLRKGAA
jgi:serine/threonine-protein kinase